MNPMKILLVTGIIASKLIRKRTKDYQKHEIYLKVLPLPIAAFLTPKSVSYYVKEEKNFQSTNTNTTTTLNNIDMIIVPGLMQQDTNYITQQLNTPCFKGPSNISDLNLTLDIIGKVELSTSKAADILIREEQHNNAIKTINTYNTKEKIEELLQNKSNILIGNCPLGPDFPMKVLGEIANAPELTDKQILEKVEYYINSGADMIDIGMHAGESNPEKAYHMVKLVKDNYDIPVSIDSMNEKEIKSALKGECNLVLSLDHGNYMKVINDIKDYNVSAVIIPTNYAKNFVPTQASQKVESLEKLDKKCEKISTISDLLLDPINSPSVTESIIAYKQYHERNPAKPIFFGAGNVNELLDADSNGVNALLSGIAMEIGANILFTPESSTKTRNSIRELKTASNMMFLAKLNNNIPKNLGLNLINYKDAHRKEDVKIETSNLPHINAVGDGKFIPDTKGSFKIVVEDNLIKAILFKEYKKNLVITGVNARDMYEEILRRNLISRMEHAAYLGMELQKAEIALKLDKTYIQDFPIF